MSPQKAATILTFTSTGEASYGTTGATTRKLHGLTDASLVIAEKVEAVPAVGWFGPGPVANRVAQSGEGNIEGICLYEDMPNILNGLFSAIGASTSTAAPYAYPYAAPTNSTSVVYTYTLEYGTPSVSYTAMGVVLDGINVKGEAGGYWTYSSPLLAKQVKNVTPTTAANVDRSVNPVRMADTTLYLDAFSTGTIGTTAISASLISFEADVKMNRHTKTFAGSLYPGSWGDDRTEATLKMVLEFSSTQQTFLQELVGSTGVALQRQIRIQASQDSSASQKIMRIDFAGILSENVKLWDDRDGNMTIDLTFTGKHSTALNTWGRFHVENGSSSTT